MTDLPLTGGCSCGAVRFEIDAPLFRAVYCHCTRCQHRTGGAASVSARTDPAAVRVVAGADRLRAWAPEGGLENVFCGDCGAALLVRVPGTEDLVAVRLGAVDGDPGVRPQARQFVAYAAAWEPIPDDGLPRYDERLPPAAA